VLQVLTKKGTLKFLDVSFCSAISTMIPLWRARFPGVEIKKSFAT